MDDSLQIGKEMTNWHFQPSIDSIQAVALALCSHTQTHITMTAQAAPNPSTRWNLVISEQTNVAVRSFLAQRGFKKGDLSSFVEEAVRWRVFDQTLARSREGFDALGTQESENLLDEALEQVRAEQLQGGAYDTFRPSTAR